MTTIKKIYQAKTYKLYMLRKRVLIGIAGVAITAITTLVLMDMGGSL